MTYVIGVDTHGTFTDAFGRRGRPGGFRQDVLHAARARYDVGAELIVTGDVASVGFLTTRGHAGSIAIMNLVSRHRIAATEPTWRERRQQVKIDQHILISDDGVASEPGFRHRSVAK